MTVVMCYCTWYAPENYIVRSSCTYTDRGVRNDKVGAIVSLGDMSLMISLTSFFNLSVEVQGCESELNGRHDHGVPEWRYFLSC